MTLHPSDVTVAEQLELSFSWEIEGNILDPSSHFSNFSLVC